MNCAECTEQLVPHLEGLLDQSQQSQLKSHLDDCPTCRAELDRMQHLFDSLIRRGQAAPGVSPEFRLTDRLIVEQTSKRRRNMMKRIVKTAVAAVLLIGVLLGITQFFGGGNGVAALAAVSARLQQAKTISWTEVAYQRLSSKDGKEVWLEPLTRHCMYKAPGRTRTEILDSDGQVREIVIEDLPGGARLLLNCKTKEARMTLTDGAKYYIADVFTIMSKHLDSEDLEFGRLALQIEALGERQINGRRARGWRVTQTGPFAYSEDPYSEDLWVDIQTKHMLQVHLPSLNRFDPDTDPARNNPPGERASRREAAGKVCRDIVYDLELDDSLFSVTAPEGYTVTTRRVPEPTEKDMIEWLGIQAQCNDNTFWDNPAFGGKELRRIIDKSIQGGQLTAAEQGVVDRTGRPHTHHPVHRFMEMTASHTWHYAGKGVKLGDNTAIVCWYKPKDSKTYRVVYGDLSVKDIAPEDLPSQAEP